MGDRGGTGNKTLQLEIISKTSCRSIGVHEIDSLDGLLKVVVQIYSRDAEK